MKRLTNRKTLHITLLIIAIVILIAGIILTLMTGDTYKNIAGVLYGVGAGLTGLSIANLTSFYYLKRHPQEAKQERIEAADERNVYIRHKAHAKASRVTRIATIIAAFITILMDTPLWITVMLIGLYLLDYLLTCWYIGRIQKEM